MILRIILVGFVMGAAEVAPGISGGTIAFVSGFYERLVNGIKGLTSMRLLASARQGPAHLWRDLDIGFLLLLFASMMLSVFLLARGISYLLEFHSLPIWSFFFGLVMSSAFVIGRRLARFDMGTWSAIATGAVLGVLMTRVVPVAVEASPLMFFAGGCIAVCAWILPGLSGSFVLLVLGLYQAVIAAIKNFELLTLSYVALGCVLGLAGFSRLLSMLLARFHHGTLAVLVGFMSGSLVKVWPWQYTTSYQIRPDGGQTPLVQEPVLPATYQSLTGEDPALIFAALACLAGVCLILLLERFALLAETGARKDGG